MITDAAAKYLWDLQRAVERIVRFIAGRTFDDYLVDEMLSAAVERQFEIIGEALVCLRRIAPDVAAMVPDSAQIVGFRNVLNMPMETSTPKRSGAPSRTICRGCGLLLRICSGAHRAHSAPAAHDQPSSSSSAFASLRSRASKPSVNQP